MQDNVLQLTKNFRYTMAIEERRLRRRNYQRIAQEIMTQNKTPT